MSQKLAELKRDVDHRCSTLISGDFKFALLIMVEQLDRKLTRIRDT